MLRKHLPMHCKQAGKMSNHSTCMLLCNFVMCQTESVLSSLSNKSRVGLLANTCSHARLQIGLFPARGQFPCAQPALHLWDSQVKAGSGGYRGSHLRRVPQRDAGSGAWHLAPAHTHTHAHAHTHTANTASLAWPGAGRQPHPSKVPYMDGPIRLLFVPCPSPWPACWRSRCTADAQAMPCQLLCRL